MSSLSEVSQRFVSNPPKVTARTVTISIRPSILRLGLAVRLAGVCVVLCAIWGMIGWTVQ